MHFIYFHAKNTSNGMFDTTAPDGLTSHCQVMLDQINTLIETGQKGLFYSYDEFCKSYLPVGHYIQTLNNKYDVHWCDIGESEAKFSYDVVVFFGNFNVLDFDIPRLWRTYVVPKKTPVIFYTTPSWRGYEMFQQVAEVERVEFDEIVPRLRPIISGEPALKSSTVNLSSKAVPVVPPNVSIPDRRHPPKSGIHQKPPTVPDQKAADTSEDNLALRRKIKRLQQEGMSIRKIAEQLNIKKWKVEWLLKQKPSQLHKTKPHK
ncbi:helix-turn-helix domain-containing protein [Candidatus Poribacteria bacterium]|nr:helix-turn-helix domain-containing protein [Candidatus Poribacteria bacterium]